MGYNLALRRFLSAGFLVPGLISCQSLPSPRPNTPASSAATATTSTPAPLLDLTLTAVSRIIVGEFDLQRAMELLYGDEGNLETSPQGEVVIRIPRSPGSEGDLDQIIRILLAADYRETDEEKYVLLTETGPDGTGPHAAMAQIGGAVFHKVENAWLIEIERYITMMGSFGHAPEGDLENIGPDKHGFLFQPLWAGQGNEMQNAILIGVVRQTFKIIFTHEVFIHGETEDTVWEYSSEMKLFPGANPEYYDIRMTTQGTQPIQGEINPFEKVEEFEFNGEEYTLKNPGTE